jgi:hypothetical protein
MTTLMAELAQRVDDLILMQFSRAGGDPKHPSNKARARLRARYEELKNPPKEETTKWST